MLINLLSEVWSDFQESKVWWQVAVILVSALFSYFVYRFLAYRFPAKRSATDLGAPPSFAGVMFLAVWCAFLYSGMLLLSESQHVYLLSLLIPIVGSLAFVRLGIYLSRRIFVRTHPIGGLHLFIERVFAWGIALIVILYFTGWLQDVLTFVQQTKISIGRNKISIEDILQALISIVMTVMLALFTSAALERRLLKVESLHFSLRIALSRLGRSLLIICAVLISLNLVGIDLTVLSIFSGALGVGLGIGLQKIASNYVAGLIILLDRSLSINDLITVDKYSGRVRRINTRYTILKGLDGIESIIPNELLISSPVHNFSLADKGIWVSTSLNVVYETDIESLLPMLIEEASKVEGVSAQSLPSVNLVKFGTYGFELTINVLIINLPDKAKILSEVNRAVWKLLQQKGIKVAYPKVLEHVLN